MSEQTLSIRQADTVAKFLSEKGNGKMSASSCRYKTMAQIARDYLGSSAKQHAVEALVSEIKQRLGLS